MNKGVAYSLEALVGVTLIIIALVTLFSNPGAITPTSEIKQLTDESLRSLDDSGKLRFLVSNGDEAGIESEMSDILPSIVNLDVEICQPNCDDVDTPEDRNVFTSFYYISGYPGSYNATEIVVFTWENI